MGLGGIGIWQLLIVLVIVLLLFGTKRLRGLGGDLGGAIKGFKKAMTGEGEGTKTEEGEIIDEDPKKVADDATDLDNEDLAQAKQTEAKQTENK